MLTYSRFSVTFGDANAKLASQRRAEVQIKFAHIHRGLYIDRLDLLFEDAKLQKRLLITRSLSAMIGDEPEYHAMRPKGPYIPQKRVQRDPETDVIPGIPPPALQAIRYVQRLPHAPIPGHLARILASGSLTYREKEFATSLLPRVLDSSTYNQYFKLLIWAEEHRSE